MNRLPTEGGVFFIPLENGKYARGVAARVVHGRSCMFGYFFGPAINRSNVSIDDLEPSATILRARCSDIAFAQGRWIVYSEILPWDRKKWNLPYFIRKDILGRRPTEIVRYGDDLATVMEKFRTNEEIDGVSDSLAGYGFIEDSLFKIMK